MKPQDKIPFSSRQLLEKIGIPDGVAGGSLTLLDEAVDDMEGDLAALLRERYRQLKEVRHILRPGMVIGWKPGLKNRRFPVPGRPAIVIELLDQPLRDDLTEPGSTYFREPLDMVIGLFMDSGEHRGDFFVFHANSERYQPWPGEEG